MVKHLFGYLVHEAKARAPDGLLPSSFNCISNFHVQCLCNPKVSFKFNAFGHLSCSHNFLWIDGGWVWTWDGWNNEALSIVRECHNSVSLQIIPTRPCKLPPLAVRILAVIADNLLSSLVRSSSIGWLSIFITW